MSNLQLMPPVKVNLAVRATLLIHQKDKANFCILKFLDNLETRDTKLIEMNDFESGR